MFEILLCLAWFSVWFLSGVCSTAVFANFTSEWGKSLQRSWACKRGNPCNGFWLDVASECGKSQLQSYVVGPWEREIL